MQLFIGHSFHLLFKEELNRHNCRDGVQNDDAKLTDGGLCILRLGDIGYPMLAPTEYKHLMRAGLALDEGVWCVNGFLSSIGAYSG